MFRKLLDSITGQRTLDRQAQLYRNLIRHEARIGGQLFGPVPKGGRREFFCLDEHTWVWHEEWTDRNGQHQLRTTRYDVRPNGILKAQNGQYQPVSYDEAKHLQEAAKLYQQKIQSEIYSFVA
jgi:hypothetical protein